MFDIAGENVYTSATFNCLRSGVTATMKIFVFIILFAMVSVGTAMASEPTKSLLNELIQPHLTAGDGTHGLEAGGHVSHLVDQPQQVGIPLSFTLEELHSESAVPSELALPDDEPAADIPLALNEKVEYFINYFQTKGRGTYAAWLARSTSFLPMMKEILRKEGLPDELVYVAMIESGFQLHARSSASAVGPWQFISGTGRRYSLRIDQWVDERKDPVKATMAAAMYLKDLYGMFNSDWYLAAAGYNAGENKIFRAIDRYETSDFWELSKGSYLKRETKEYVPKLLAAAIIAKDPAHYGFVETVSVPVIEYDTVTLKGRTDLELAARLTGTTYQTIKGLNPALRHWCTPPNYPDYELKIPKGTKSRFEHGIAAIPEEQRFSEKSLFSRYTATRKDNLKKIAHRFGSTPMELAKLNGLKGKERIAGKTLVVPLKHPVDFVSEGHSGGKAALPIRYYTVRRGDTLHALAKRFKVPTKVLAAWNNMKEAVALMPGKRLIVAKATKSAHKTG